MNVNIAAGLVQGASGVSEYAQNLQERQQRLAMANQQRQMGEIQLQEYKQNAPLRQQTEELKFQQYEAQVRQMQATTARNTVYDAFKLFDADGNAGHLNNALQLLKNNPVAQSWTGGAVRFDQVTSADAKLLQQSGVKDVQGFLSHPELMRSVAVVTGQDGTKTLVDMNQLKAGMGYTQFMEDEELDRMAKRALMLKRLQLGGTVEKETQADRVIKQLMEDDPTLSYTDAWKLYKNPNPSKGTTALERSAQAIIDEAVARGEEPPVWTDAMGMAAQKTSPTGKQKDMVATDDAKSALDAQFGGSFLTADLSDPKVRTKAEPYIRRIEQFSGAEMDTSQKKRVAEIRQLITLGQAGSELTSAETGPLDSLLRDGRKYISDNIEGTDATAAYQAYRNLVRNALFGASLTNNEQAEFDKAFGTLKEQTGPVLAKLRTQLQMLQDELGAIYDSGDEYVMKYRLGMDSDRLVQVMNALDQRLEMFDNQAPEGTEVIVPAQAPKKLSKEESLAKARELLK